MRVLLLAAILVVPSARAQQPASSDTAAVIATARDYIDGFFEGDSTRVRRSLHEDVAKRRISGEAGSPGEQSTDDLVLMTARMAGRGNATMVSADSISVMAIDGDIAMVRIGVAAWVDHLHIARFGAEWKIINVSWQTR